MTLYRNGNEESVISAVWEVKNGTVTTNFLNPAYTGKIFMEIDKTPFIMICNADQTLSAKYLVIYDKDTPGPKVDLKIIGNLTEDEFHKLLDDDLGFMKKYFGNLTEGQIVKIRKLHDDNTEHIKEYLGNLTEEQIEKIRKMQDDNTEDIKEYLEKVMQEKMLPSNHPKEVLKESSDRCNPLFLGLLICIIGILIGIIYLCIRLPANRIKIRDGLKNMKDWIQKKLCCQCNFENGVRTQGTAVNIEEPELSQDQVHTWLNEHPDFMDTYLGKLTEDQICMQIRNWMDAYPGLLKNKALDAHENDQVVPPTLDELSVTLTQHSGTGIDGNTNMSVSTQEICIASQHSDEDGNDCQAVTPTLVEPPVTMTGSGNEIDGNQIEMSARKTFVDSEISDEDGNDCQLVTPTLVEPPVTMTGSGNEIDGNQIEMSARKTFVDSEISAQLVKNDTSTDLTLSDLAVTWCGPVTGTEDNHDQLELYSTCNSPSSATFSVSGPSGIQPFNKDKQDANPAQDTEQDVRVDIEESDSEDKSQEPLLAENPEQEDNIQEKRGTVE
ncbi:hypothetical protein ACJMK2_025683 [Sinanodonta woodiana]|uniref:Uncharacterized protein n=1 Tax=Sinanodonta woodiana TaxID=1069815 RepID=A0ABD3XJM9_SINWO